MLKVVLVKYLHLYYKKDTYMMRSLLIHYKATLHLFLKLKLLHV